MTENNINKITKEFSSKLLISLLVHIIIALALLVFSWFLSLKITDIFSLTNLQKWLLLISLSLIVIGLTIFFFYNRKYVARLEAAPSDFYVIEKEFTHEYLEPQKIKHTRRWTLKALRNGLDHFPDKYCWTGNKVDFKATINGHKAVENGYRNVFTLYRYEFGKTLKKGKTIEIEVEFILYGEHKYFISTPIEESTDKLIMSIIFPISWNVTSALLDISPMSGAKVPNEDEVSLDKGRYKWVVPKPKLMHHYEMKWNLSII